MHTFDNKLTSQPNAAQLRITGLVLGQLHPWTSSVSPAARGARPSRPQWEYLAFFIDDKDPVDSQGHHEPRHALGAAVRGQCRQRAGSPGSTYTWRTQPRVGCQGPISSATTRWNRRSRRTCGDRDSAWRTSSTPRPRSGPATASCMRKPTLTPLAPFSSVNGFQAGFTAQQQEVSPDNGITPAFYLDDGWPAFQGTVAQHGPGPQRRRGGRLHEPGCRYAGIHASRHIQHPAPTSQGRCIGRRLRRPRSATSFRPISNI